MSRIIAVFLYDGSDKYSDMTLNAIRSFLENTKEVKVGILVNPAIGEPDWGKLFPSFLSRLDVRSWKEHFSWNPTQHKLDLQEFTDNYDLIIWVDSDTVTYQDLTGFIEEFQASGCTIGLVPDLVITKPGFTSRWNQSTGSLNPSPFVPQCAFMLFKKEIIPRLFPVWKSLWRKWIEPSPFTNYGDPDPEFHGSAFCIEQYALGLSLEQLNLLTDGSLFIIGRRQLVFKDGGNIGAISGTGGIVGPNANHASFPGTSGETFRVSPSSLYHLGGSSYQPHGGGSYQYQPSSYQVGSYQLGSYQTGSYQTGSYQLGSYQGSSQLGSYQGSSQLGSYQSGSYQLGSYQGSSQLGSYQLGSYQLGSYQFGLSHSSSYPGYGGSSFQDLPKLDEAFNAISNVGVVHIPQGLDRDIVVDSFAGGIVHFYSFNYGAGYPVWNQNQEKIEQTLKQLWKK